MKKFQCDNCGAAMTIDEEQLTAVCEYCGTTISLLDTHPEYAEAISEKEANAWEETYERIEMKAAPKKIAILIIVFAWVIIIAVFGIVFMEMSMLRDGFGKPVYVENGNTELNWPTTGLSTVLPEPAMEKGEVFVNSEEHFSASIYGATQQDFDTYVTACREIGFDIAAEGSDSSFYAYNAEGYYLDIFYWDESGELNIYLDEPIDENEYIDFREQKRFNDDNTSEIISLPALPSIDGTNVLFVNTEVQPGKVYVQGNIEEIVTASLQTLNTNLQNLQTDWQIENSLDVMPIERPNLQLDVTTPTVNLNELGGGEDCPVLP